MLLPLSGTEEGRRSIYIRFSGFKEAGEISQTMAGEVVTYIGLQLPDSSPAPKRAGEVFIYTSPAPNKCINTSPATPPEKYLYTSPVPEKYLYTPSEKYLYTPPEKYLYTSPPPEKYLYTPPEKYLYTPPEKYLYTPSKTLPNSLETQKSLTPRNLFLVVSF